LPSRPGVAFDALHGVVDRMRAAVACPEVQVVGEHDHAGEATFLRETADVLEHDASGGWVASGDRGPPLAAVAMMLDHGEGPRKASAGIERPADLGRPLG